MVVGTNFIARRLMFVCTLFSDGKPVQWEQAKSFTQDQRDALCSSAHELTGHGPAKMKESVIIDAYLKFSAKYKPVFTEVLRCKQDNKKGHTYFVTQGVDKNALTLIQTDPSTKKIRGKDVFRFFWTVGQVRGVPTLQKLNA